MSKSYGCAFHAVTNLATKADTCDLIVSLIAVGDIIKEEKNRYKCTTAHHTAL